MAKSTTASALALGTGRRLMLARLLAALSCALALALAAPEAYAKKKKPKSVAETIQQKFSDAIVPAPEDQEVCFSPDERCGAKVTNFIKSAQKTLDVAIFDI